jgi:hypothetical protein
MSDWLFEGKEITDEEIPEKAVAFLYIITHVETGRWYIGRKNIFRKVTKSVKLKNGNLRKKRSLVGSDWRKYWSSSEFLKEWVKQEGEEKFKREILIFVETAAATIYGEESLLYMSGAMFDPLCMNGHIRTKIMRKWFDNKETKLHERLKSCLLSQGFVLQ